MKIVQTIELSCKRRKWGGLNKGGSEMLETEKCFRWGKGKIACEYNRPLSLLPLETFARESSLARTTLVAGSDEKLLYWQAQGGEGWAHRATVLDSPLLTNLAKVL